MSHAPTGRQSYPPAAYTAPDSRTTSQAASYYPSSYAPSTPMPASSFAPSSSSRMPPESVYLYYPQNPATPSPALDINSVMPSALRPKRLTQEQRELYTHPSLRKERFGSSPNVPTTRLNIVQELTRTANAPSDLRPALADTSKRDFTYRPELLQGRQFEPQPGTTDALLRKLEEQRHAEKAAEVASHRLALTEGLLAGPRLALPSGVGRQGGPRSSMAAFPAGAGYTDTAQRLAPGSQILPLPMGYVKTPVPGNEQTELVSRYALPAGHVDAASHPQTPAATYAQPGRPASTYIGSEASPLPVGTSVATGWGGASSIATPSPYPPTSTVWQSQGNSFRPASSIRPESSISHVEERRPSLYGGSNQLVPAGYQQRTAIQPRATPSMTLDSYIPQDMNTNYGGISTGPARSTVGSTVGNTPSTRKPNTYRQWEAFADHEYLYELERSHASRGLPCFCCE